MINSGPTPPLTMPLGTRDHVLGPPDARLVLVEYGDYQCPHCRRAHPIVRQIVARFGDQLKFGFRHFPLSKIHPQARLAAQAAEAAAAQEKFWQMHDLLFRHQDELELDHLAQYAAVLELDVPRFRDELNAGLYARRVQEDVVSGLRSGVNGTPTFYVHNKRFNGGYELDALVNALDTPPTPDTPPT
ncbi:MAG: thioredoxin domain-containing protein [Tepidisphaeraceae bacterium]|jgi:protein-disulfide isomerase